MRYESFDVGREYTGYKLHVGNSKPGYGAGMELHSGMKFSTYDKDQDPNSSVHCASEMHGGWWYNDCKSTSITYQTSNLNGAYDGFGNLKDAAAAFSWQDGYYPLKSCVMMVRRK